MRVPATLVLLLSMAALPLMADEVPPRFRVAVEVTVPDEDLAERVTEYLARELQALGDVAVTSDNPDYKLFAVVMQVRTSRDTRMAYVIAVSVASYFPDRYLDYVLDETLVNINDVRNDLGAANIYENQFVSLAGPTEQNLQEVVSNVVKKFDGHVLLPARGTTQSDAEPSS